MIKPLVAFRSNNVLQPCKKVLVSLRYKLKRRLTILIRRRRGSSLPQLLRRVRPSKSPSSRSITARSSKKTLKGKVSSFFSTLFHPKKNNKNTDMVRDLSSSFSNVRSGPAIDRLMSFAHSPKLKGTPKGGQKEKDDVEDACRSFEKYLVEMIVEEGKTRDLMDVEELLYCWSNLKCPVFVGLVSRFYGELCKDLFMDVSVEEEEEDVAVTSVAAS